MDAISVIAMDSWIRPSARSLTVLSIATLLAVGCGTEPYRPPASTRTPVPSSAPPPVPAPRTDPGTEIVALANQLVGAPYRFGGSGPREFDCSGLVYFVHSQLGIQVPRTAAEQAEAAAPVDALALAPGDLVFFTESGPEITHVGIYAGQGRFVHAPKTGRPVGYGSLLEDYYLHNFAGAGRFYRAP